MIEIKRRAVRSKYTFVFSAGIAALAGALAALFHRSLAVRTAEQSARIERTGLAGMI